MLVPPKGTSWIEVAAPHPARGGGESVICDPCQKPQPGTCLAVTVIEPGKWALGWRWDCEESTQVWASCADISIKRA